MPGHRNFKQLRDPLAEQVGEDHLAERERQALERYEAEERRLADVRKARSLTQTQLANALGIDQSEVSRIEHRTDLYISTLASYVDAMGGKLELVGVFEDTGERVVFDIGELVRGTSPTPPKRKGKAAKRRARFTVGTNAEAIRSGGTVTGMARKVGRGSTARSGRSRPAKKPS